MGFFKYVFNFDDHSKSEMLNIIQYSMISVIPIVMLNKVMQKYVPEAEDEKGSLELLAEIIIQIIVMFIGILFINRTITYIPTYSGIKYPEFSVTYIILAVLIITLSLQTKLGEKVSILCDRINELWDGVGSKDKKKKKGGSNSSGNVRVSQPISQGGQEPNDAMQQTLYGGGMGQSTPISSLPVLNSNSQQQMPDYNATYQGNGGSGGGGGGGGSIGGSGDGMIMAANEALGGSSFGANF
jgi:hypothetical protein